ncbi:MAG: hypothetical protein WC915_04210 [archaeon]|jgi:hypothetical protein
MPKRGSIKKTNAGKPLPKSIEVSKINPKKYWEHPIYQHLAKKLRDAQKVNSEAEISRLSLTIQALMSGKLTMVELHELEMQRREQVKSSKAERKKNNTIHQPKINESTTNLTDLKKRIFNPQTSQANMIKSFDRLPKDSQISVAKSLTPFLRSKMSKNLEKKGF